MYQQQGPGTSPLFCPASPVVYASPNLTFTPTSPDYLPDSPEYASQDFMDMPLPSTPIAGGETPEYTPRAE
ncbi:hypothetical protein LTS18_002022 [Coniosporium uncinatum]|uniref:Uncharacterized protein n=1 Tax=Coniosporium uncinatum TaxID=93489 RepID=A0ACC3DUY4_9PEZI|nr:hypothetical protein LTS18_002022 [Coniosporium uncinatum]